MAEKIRLRQVVVVEGRYDKAKLSSVLDAVILTTNGYGIFKDKEQLALLRTLAEKHGLVILTDSDTAGFRIRRYLAGAVSKGRITHVYIPDILGKEKRKEKPSAEGKLGVEGVPVQLLREAFQKAGLGEGSILPDCGRRITKLDLYEDGLSGGPRSGKLRQSLKKKLELPELLGVNALVEVLNSMLTYEEYREIIDRL